MYRVGFFIVDNSERELNFDVNNAQRLYEQCLYLFSIMNYGNV